jgi:hypothetical protein
MESVGSESNISKRYRHFSILKLGNEIPGPKTLSVEPRPLAQQYPEPIRNSN